MTVPMCLSHAQRGSSVKYHNNSIIMSASGMTVVFEYIKAGYCSFLYCFHFFHFCDVNAAKDTYNYFSNGTVYHNTILSEYLIRL